MSGINPECPAFDGRHRFSITTKLTHDYGLGMPCSGATQVVAARGASGFLDAFSIGADGLLHHFTRDDAGKWSWQRLPWTAHTLTAVPQRDGTEKVFFGELEGDTEKTATVYELENAGREPQRRLVGRFTTRDPKVFGLGELSGAQSRDGSNILVTALAASPEAENSNWVVLFGHGSSTGALSLGEGKGVVASKVAVASEDPGSVRWPHMTFVLIYEDEIRIEWGSRNGALLQSERIEIPKLASVVEVDVVRDHGGHLQIFALDRDHRLHTLCQVGGGGAQPPRWASSWLQLDGTQDDGSHPTLRSLEAVRRSDGDLEIFALDGDDRLWTIAERSVGSAQAWGPLRDVGMHAAHIAVGTHGEDLVEVFAVSRQSQLLWLRRDHGHNWRLEKIEWGAPRPEGKKRNVYRTGLTILDADDDAVSGVPVAISATERLPTVVNGLAYAIGPNEVVVAQTNACGRINVVFELDGERSVPSLSFEAGFLDGGLLDVCPERKAHLFIPSAAREQMTDPDSSTQMYLIPEDTLIEQARETD